MNIFFILWILFVIPFLSIVQYKRNKKNEKLRDELLERFSNDILAHYKKIKCITDTRSFFSYSLQRFNCDVFVTPDNILLVQYVRFLKYNTIPAIIQLRKTSYNNPILVPTVHANDVQKIEIYQQSITIYTKPKAFNNISQTIELHFKEQPFNSSAFLEGLKQIKGPIL